MATTIGRVEFTVIFDGKSLPRQARQIGTAAAKAFDQGFGNGNKNLAALNRNSDRFFKRWKELPHGFRQVVLYTGLFAALSSQISILGSVAGSSLGVLGIAAVALGAGLAALLVGLRGVTGEMSEIAPAAQPAIQAFRDLAGPFQELQQSVQGSLFGGLEGQIATLSGTLIPVLNTGLTGLARVLNGLFAEILTGLQSARGLETLQTLFQGFEPILGNIGQAIINLVAALGNIAVIGIPYAQAFAASFGELIQRFLDFTSSFEGQQAIAVWFENGARVMEAILPLVGAVALALNQLVTPDTIALFIETLGFLTQFIPVLGGILGAIAMLDPVGILAFALQSIGAAIEPLLPQLTLFGLILGTAIKEAIATIAPVLPLLIGAIIDLAVAILPLVTSLLPLIAQLIVDLAPIVTDLITAVTPLIPLLSDLLVNAVQFVIDVFSDITPLINSVIGTFSGLINFITGVFTGNWRQAWQGIAQILDGIWSTSVNTIKGAINLIISLINNVIRGANSVTAGFGGWQIPLIPKLASGALITAPMTALIGEAGPEMVVPLNRPLGLVDPQVRAMSAIAQGKAVPALSGGGRSVTVAPGAIQIIGVRDERAAANAALDRVVALAGG